MNYIGENDNEIFTFRRSDLMTSIDMFVFVFANTFFAAPFLVGLSETTVISAYSFLVGLAITIKIHNNRNR